MTTQSDECNHEFDGKKLDIDVETLLANAIRKNYRIATSGDKLEWDEISGADQDLWLLIAHRGLNQLLADPRFIEASQPKYKQVGLFHLSPYPRALFEISVPIDHHKGCAEPACVPVFIEVVTKQPLQANECMDYGPIKTVDSIPWVDKEGSESE